MNISGVSKLPLTDFRRWLKTDQKLSDTTIANYLSAVRAFLRDRETANELIKNPARFACYAVEYDASFRGPMRSGIRSGIRAFTEYVKVRNGVTLSAPFPDERKGPRANRTVRPLHPLGEPLRDLERRGVSFNRIPFIYWRDVEGAVAGQKVILHDRQKGSSYSIPYNTIKTLNFWAGGGTWAEKEQPLVPFEPKTRVPMQARRLMRIARS